jgi:hypothetical protein
MALVLKDRVKETTTSTGTGTINLAGAATGFEGFVSAVGSGNACYYTILDANGSAWEVGIGTVTDAATDTLSRDTILESSNSDSGVSLSSGTHTVFLTYPADKSVYRNSNDQIVATASGIVFSDGTVQTTATEDYYVEATPTSPNTNLSNFTLAVDLSTLPQAWWDEVDSSDGTKGRTFRSDGTQLASDWIDFDNVGQSGILRVKWDGTLSTSETNKLQVKPPKESRVSYGVSGTYGQYNAYDSDFLAYYPLGVDANNRTSASLNGTANNVVAVSGKFGDAYDFNGSTSWIDLGDNTLGAALNGAAGVTTLMWVNPDAFSGTKYDNHLLKITNDGTKAGVWLNITDDGSNNVLAGGRSRSSDSFQEDESTATISTGAWSHITSILDYGNDEITIGLAGLLESAASVSFGSDTYVDDNPSENDAIIHPSPSQRDFDGKIGQVLISSSVRSSGWIYQEYNQTNNNSGFWGTWSEANESTKSHPTISAASSSNNSGRTYIQDLLLDNHGHVTGVATATETVTDTNTTYTAGSGLELHSTTFNAKTATTSVAGVTTLTNTINSDQDKALTPKAVNDAAYLTAHPSISGASSSNNSGRTYIQDLLLDSNGHVTGVATATETVTDTNTTYTGGTNLTLAGTTFNVDDAFLVNDADDTTTGTITAGGLSTAGLVSLGESTYQHKFDRYKVTGVTSGNAVDITLGGSALSDHYAYRIRCYDEDSSNLNGSVFLVRENNTNNGWDVKTVSIQKNSAGEFPEIFDDGGTVKVKTSATGVRDIIVYNEAIFINRNDVTGYIWGGDSIWSKVTNAGGTIDNIYTTGNVGINTETPAYPLDVNGTGNFAGIRFSDGTTQSTAGGGGSARSVAGDTDNGVITWVTSDNTFAVEAGLTYDAAGTLTATGIIDVTNTLDASDATGDTGAIRTEGGVSIAKKLYVGTDLDVDGTTNLDAVDIDGAVDLAGELKLTGAFVPGAGINAQTDDTSMGLDLSEGNYFEVTLTNGQTPVATIDITNASLGQRFMVRVIQPSNGNIVLDSVGDGWDAVQINSGSRVATKWGGGIGPTLTTGDGSADLYGFVIRGLAGSAAIDGFIIAQDLKAT